MFNISKYLFHHIIVGYLRQDWNQAHMHTQNIISGLEAVKHNSDPIIDLYSVSSNGFPFLSLPNLVLTFMG